MNPFSRDTYCVPTLDGPPAVARGNALLTPAAALRFLDNQAQRCRDRDDHEALCLLLPALLRVLDLPKMDEIEAGAFREQFKAELRKEG